MLFNSLDFAVFFPVFFVLYWLVAKRIRLRNIYPIFFFIAGFGIEKTVEILKNKLFKPIVKKTN